MGIRIGDKKEKRQRILFLPLVVSMHGGRLASCVCTSPAACGQWECSFIRRLACVCRVTSVFFFFFFSHILRLDPATSHPHRTARAESRPIVATANTWPWTLRSAGWDGGLALALFTLSATMSAWIYLDWFSHLWVSFPLFFFFVRSLQTLNHL